LSQNYRRLGLTSRLNAATGGIEKPHSKTSTASKLAISNAVPTTFEPAEARVERDPETGKIIRVIHGAKKLNPLNDTLNSDSEEEEEKEYEEFNGFEGEQKKEPVGVIRELEAQAARVAEKKPRKQSAREQEWCQRLVEKYGDDYRGMMRDRKLNPMQQTEADIARRVKKWKAEGGSEI
jgi:nucleolar protein 16